MKLKNSLLLMTVLCFAAISCDSELSTSPFDAIDATSAFQSVTDLDQGALGAYGTISGQNIYSINALMTDELRRAATNTGQGMQLFNHNLVSGDGTAAGAWNNAYVAIDRINRVLAALETIEAATPAEQTLKDRIRGEMLGLRAYQHFDLFRVFASYNTAGTGVNALAVPYMVRSEITEPVRTPKTEFFQLMSSDIEASLILLTPAGFYSNQRLTVHAVNGLKARVALYTQDWPTAISASTSVINAIPVTPRADYLGLWDDSIQGEVIWKLRRASSADGTIALTERTGNDDIFFYVSNDLATKYNETDDVRFELFTRVDVTTVQNFKYNQRAGEKNVSDIKMMRVSELRLIRAEAYARPGAQQNLTLAAADVQAIRTARLTTPLPVNFASANDALTEILAERRLELALEGHRYFDLKRYGLGVMRIASDVDGATASDELEADSPLFIFPIPQVEMFANQSMVQNPGYDE